MKVKRMGVAEILRRLWLFSANKKKAQNLLVNNRLNSSLSQLTIAAHNCHKAPHYHNGNCSYLLVGLVQFYILFNAQFFPFHFLDHYHIHIFLLWGFRVWLNLSYIKILMHLSSYLCIYYLVPTAYQLNFRTVL